MKKIIKGWIFPLIVGLLALSILYSFTWYDQRKDANFDQKVNIILNTKNHQMIVSYKEAQNGNLNSEFLKEMGIKYADYHSFIVTDPVTVNDEVIFRIK